MLMMPIWFLVFLLVLTPGLSIIGDLGFKLYPIIVAVAMLPFLLVLFASGELRVRRLSIWSLGPGAMALARLFGGLYVILYGVALFRGVNSGVTSVVDACFSLCVLLVVALIIVFYYLVLNKGRYGADGFLRIVFAVLAIFCFLNLMLWLVGIKSPISEGNTATDDTAYFFEILGVHIKRVYFPLSQGINAFGIVAGAVLSYGLFRVFDGGLLRVRQLAYRVVVYVVSPMLCLLLTDCRGAIVFVVIAFVFTKWFRNYSRSLLVVTLVLPLMLLLGGSLSDAVLKFAARDASSTGVLSGRELIWGPVLLDLAQFKLESLWGYGAYGQVVSGVSVFYASSFVGWAADENMIGAHNSYLQAILDVGYLGLIFFMLFYLSAVTAITKLEQSNALSPNRACSIHAVLVYLILQGMTEVTLSATGSLIFLVLIAIVTVFSSRHVRPVPA